MGDRNQLLHTSGLIIGYHQGNKPKQVAGPLNLEVVAGQLICLLGPNGCGKSTLLRTIAGLQGALQGHVEIEGEDLHQLKPGQIAKKISLVLTDNIRAGNLDVYALIALGRYPHSGWLGVLNKKDREIIDHAVSSTHTTPFLERKVDSLSDGECQKVMLARALAQDTPLIILDEPTAHLDLPSRIQLMRLLHQLAKDTNKAILISTHELDLALQVADQIWLMRATGELSVGLPEELVLNGSFQEAFDKDGILFDPLSGTFNIHQQGHKPVKVNGEGAGAFWTKRALIRNGYHISPAAMPAKVAITVTQPESSTEWLLDAEGTITRHATISALLRALEAAYKL